MDVNKSNCIYCHKEIHYSEARLLPQGGGVCQTCAQKRGYRPCDECQDWFISEGEETFCDGCLERLFKRLIQEEQKNMYCEECGRAADYPLCEECLEKYFYKSKRRRKR